MSKLTVASDKQHGLLGKADLDLSKYGTDDFVNFTLELESCTNPGEMVEGGTIEVALKGVENTGSPTRAASPSASADAGGASASILAVL